MTDMTEQQEPITKALLLTKGKSKGKVQAHDTQQHFGAVFLTHQLTRSALGMYIGRSSTSAEKVGNMLETLFTIRQTQAEFDMAPGLACLLKQFTTHPLLLLMPLNMAIKDNQVYFWT